MVDVQLSESITLQPKQNLHFDHGMKDEEGKDLPGVDCPTFSEILDIPEQINETEADSKLVEKTDEKVYCISSDDSSWLANIVQAEGAEEDSSVREEEQASDSESQEITQNNSLRCKYCLTVLDNRVYLEAHLHNAHGQGLEQDSVLSKLTVFNSELKPPDEETGTDPESIHCCNNSSAMNTKDIMDNGCCFCGKTFAQRRSLKRHLKTHTGDTSVKCNICTKMFDCKRTLNFHKLTHKPLNCVECDKIFYDRQKLITHVRTHLKGNQVSKTVFHMEKKLLVDNKCIPTMVVGDKSEQETLIFGRQKPFKCEHCEKAYCHKRDLRRHHFKCHPHLEYCA